MNLLSEFESRLETVFEGFFTRRFKTGVQPLEIAKRLAKEMDSGRSLGISRAYAPNRFTVWLNDEDMARLGTMEKTLASELAEFLAGHARERGYRLVAKPQVELHAQGGVRLGEIEVTAQAAEGKAGKAKAAPAKGGHTEVISAEELAREAKRLPPARLIVQGKHDEAVVSITRATTTLGRAETNEVILPDPSISRFHAEIAVSDKGYRLRDLGSTNGTFLNGAPVTSAYLEPGDQIRLGETVIEFRSGLT